MAILFSCAQRAAAPSPNSIPGSAESGLGILGDGNISSLFCALIGGERAAYLPITALQPHLIARILGEGHAAHQIVVFISRRAARAFLPLRGHCLPDDFRGVADTGFRAVIPPARVGDFTGYIRVLRAMKGDDRLPVRAVEGMGNLLGDTVAVG